MKENILSVGIDLGTSTTEVIFSYITVENMAASFRIPDVQIVDKKVIYRSQVYFTPLLSDTVLDTKKIVDIVKTEYQKAGIKPEQVQTGAVIITGDTARKENAQSVLKEISDFAGDFVVATAGPELESILAGKGSGAEEFSRKNKGKIINLDIGGGTTNTAVFENGEVLQAGCFDIGGRLLRYDKQTKKVEYIYPKMKYLLELSGRKLNVGDIVKKEDLRIITELLARAMLGIYEPDKGNAIVDFLSTNPLKEELLSVDYVSFSGGVGDLIYQKVLPEIYEYGDMGVLLAENIQKYIEKETIQLVRPRETIGATVVGAGSHSVNISGSTVTVTAKEYLPLVNVPLLKIGSFLNWSKEKVQKEFQKKITWIQGEDTDLNLALSVEVKEIPSYQKIQVLAEKIVLGMTPVLKKQDVLIVILREDIGKVLGQSIKKILPDGKEVICLDGINIGGGDYIDIGQPVGVGQALPVVIKTIAFNY